MIPRSSLIVVSTVMAICSFLAGLLPLVFNLSPSKLSYSSKFSVGLLLSTAFVLILPEGLDHYLSSPYNNNEIPNYTPIGLYLLFGFTILLSIDQISQFIQSGNKDNFLPNSSFLDVTQFEIDTDEPLSNTSFGGRRSRWEMLKSVFRNTNTLGLIIHSLTDGIALASTILSSASDEPTGSDQYFIRDDADDDQSNDQDGDQFQMSLIIVAIFVHKLPASFALTSLLLVENYNLKTVMYHLGAFSLSAPIGALITALLVDFFAVSINFSGPLLLFSGGSFLYVGFHTLVEVMNSNNVHTSHTPQGFEESNYSRGKILLNNGLLLLGMITPLLASHIHGGED